jgi:hypothetical protein
MAADTQPVDLDVTAVGELPRAELDEIRHRAAALARYAGGDVTGPRVTVRRGSPHAKASRFVADASVLAAHAAGSTPRQAVDRVVDRLIRQLRRVVGADVALRNEPRVLARALEDLRDDPRHPPAAGLRPPEERRIVHRRTYAPTALSTLQAVADLLDDDLDFYLFVHVRTNEDVVVHWRDDAKIGLLFPRGSVLADEDDVVVPEPSRYSEPLSLEAARSEMDVLNHRFLYFTDAADGRGKVLYLRHDGDYGLVEPA